MSTGPTGYLYHWSTRKLVHPRGDELKPHEDTKLIVHSRSDKDSPERLQFRFVPVQGAGHFGHIEHVSSGKVVHPKGSNLDPSSGTHLVLRSDKHAAALFGFDEENNVLIHKGGKIWQPRKETPNPADNTPIILHSDRNDAGKFYFGDKDGNPTSAYPEPNLSGDWKLLRAFVTPMADHTYRETYKIGRSKTDSRVIHHAWGVSAEVAKSYFSAKAEYSGFVENTSNETWSEEREETHEIHVKQGQSVFVWQYVFDMSQYSEKLHFQSSIIGDTDCKDKKPVFRK